MKGGQKVETYYVKLSVSFIKRGLNEVSWPEWILKNN